jgi:hypothetical protein
VTDTLTVDEAWTAVMDEIRSVGKGDFNQDQGFRFRGVDSVVNATGPAFRTHGIKVIPKRIVDIVRTEYETKRGTRMVNKEVTVEWEVRGPKGDSFTGESVGEAADAGDKSISKAQSVAYRVFLLEALNIPTGNADPDEESHERASAPVKSDADTAREELLAAAPEGWNGAKLADRFLSDHGVDIRQADAATVRAFTKAILAEAEAEPS